MIRLLIISVLLVLVCSRLLGQSYEVSASYEYPREVENEIYTLITNSGNLSNSTGVFKTTSEPLELIMELLIITYSPSEDPTECLIESRETIDASLGCMVNSGIVNDCTSIGIVNTQIILNTINDFSETSLTSGSTICPTDPINLVGNSGFDLYKWQFKTIANGWQDLHSGTSNELSLDVYDLLGSDLTPYYDTYLYFRYLAGDCGDYTNAPSIDYKLGNVEPIPTIVASPQTCFGEADGSIKVTGLNRELVVDEDVTYSIEAKHSSYGDNSDIGEFNDLAPGEYIIVLFTSLYCGEQTEYSVVVKEAVPINISSKLSEVICHNSSTGSATFTASGGAGSGYSYSMDGLNFQSSPTFDNLLQGDHLIHVKDAKNCLHTDGFTVLGPGVALDANATIVSNYNGSALSCATALDGIIEVSGSGGWGNYLYSLSAAGPFSTDGTFSNLAAGTTSVWIKDEGGCLVQKEVMISPPDEISASVEISKPNCPGDFGQLTINASGGTGNLQYSLDGVNYTLNNEFFVPAGIYSAFVRDENLCIYEVNNLELVDPLAISFEINAVAPDCFGNATGQIDFNNTINGNAPFRYSINGGASFQPDSSFYDLPSGDYFLHVVDENNCLSTGFISIPDPDPVVGSIIETPITCFGSNDGELLVIPSGGTGSYGAMWSTGEDTDKISDLKPDIYSVLITDTNGCEGEPIIYELTEPDEIIVTELITDYNGYPVSCAGAADGEIELLISGGKVAAEYVIQWSSGEDSSTITGLLAGEYTVDVQDDNGCNASVTYILSEPNPLVLNDVIVENPRCNGSEDGDIMVVASGGTGALQYEITELAIQSAGHFSDLRAGSYTVEAIDVNGCILETVVDLHEPDKMEVAKIKTVSASCGNTDGEIEVEISGGTPPYLYEWIDFNGNSMGSESTISNIPGGTYNLIVTDAYNCSLTTELSVSDADGPTITIQEISDISCHGSTDGRAIIDVSGGQAPYFIEWSSGGDEFTQTNLAAGLHSVSVIDDNGCLVFAEFEVSDKEPISIDEMILLPPDCNGSSNGSIEIIPFGGTPPFTYEWQVGSNSALINNVSAGEYEVIVEDSLGCAAEFVIQLPEPELLHMNTEIIAPTCSTVNNGVLELGITGGTEPYTAYMNDILLSSHIIDTLASEEYVMDIIDANGCTISQNIEIPKAQPLTLEMEDLVICDGQQVEVFSPLVGANYSWWKNEGIISNEDHLIVTSGGIYTLEVESADGCTTTGSFSVSISSDVLNIDFLSNTMAYVQDTLILIDITYPIPDSVTWLVPNEAELIEANNDYALLVFREEGLFNVSMEAFLGNCYEIEHKEIEVLDRNKDNPTGGRILGETASIIKEASVYPNPTDGLVAASYRLREPQKISYYVINLASNQTFMEGSREAYGYHALTLNLINQPSGLYAIVLKTDDESHISRVLKR